MALQTSIFICSMYTNVLYAIHDTTNLEPLSLSLSPHSAERAERTVIKDPTQGRSHVSRSGGDFEAHHRGLTCMNLKAQETWDTYCRNDPGKYGLTLHLFLEALKTHSEKRESLVVINLYPFANCFCLMRHWSMARFLNSHQFLMRFSF